jgi:hypothetical protein
LGDFVSLRAPGSQLCDFAIAESQVELRVQQVYLCGHYFAPFYLLNLDKDSYSNSGYNQTVFHIPTNLQTLNHSPSFQVG